MGKQIVIIGGMAAGCKIASRLSRIRPDFNIIILEKGKYLSFSSCGLPLFASGELDNIDELNKTSYNTIRDINYFKDVKGITAYTNSEVISILPSEQTLSYKNLTNQEISELNYDYLVFATGSTHKKIPFPYHQSRRLSNFSKPEDALNFRQLAQKGLIKNAVIIGAGFIGCELAEAMISLWGIQTTILEKEDSILPGFLDKETSAIVRKHIEDKGVFIKTNVSVNEIVAVNEDKLKITFNEETLYTDYIFLCIGSIPETKLAKKTGIRLGKSGGIIVNKYFETNINNIYACGDCTEIMNQVTCKPEWFSNGSFANRQARIVANNISVDGYNNDFEKQSYFGTVNPVSFKIFGLNIASVGLTADSAIKYGLNLASHCATFHDRPHYHPDSKLLFAKIIYKKNNLKIVGLQLIGEGEVTRYIDIFSVLLSRYSNINDLLDLEHCYTPAHSSPLSPLNELAAMVINKEFENIDSIAPFDINTFHGEIIDLREENEVKKNPFKLSSKNIPVNKLRENIPLLDKEKEYLMVCQIGQRSYEATRIMTNTRFSKVKYLEGGISFLNL